MTVKQLFAKVATYNELAAIANKEQLTVCYDGGGPYQSNFLTFQEFMEFADYTFLDRFTRCLLDEKNIEFNKAVTINWYGEKTEVTFII